MAVARLVHVEDIGEKEYNAVIDAVGLAANPAKGGIVHIAGPGPRGWRVFDLWESEDAFETYERERLIPAFRKTGMISVPHSELYPVYKVQLPDTSVFAGAGRNAAVAQIVEIGGASRKEYDRATEIMRADVEAPRGMFLHVAGETPTGWRNFNLWKSEQAFDDFRRERLEPAFRKIGANWQPRIEWFPLYRLFAPNLAALAGVAASSQRARV